MGIVSWARCGLFFRKLTRRLRRKVTVGGIFSYLGPWLTVKMKQTLLSGCFQVSIPIDSVVLHSPTRACLHGEQQVIW